MKTLAEMMKEGEPLEAQSIAALKRYREAQAANCPLDELDKLRLEADYAFKTFSDYQFMVLGFHMPTHH